MNRRKPGIFSGGHYPGPDPSVGLSGSTELLESFEKSFKKRVVSRLQNVTDWKNI
jgi:hypothetical protein